MARDVNWYLRGWEYRDVVNKAGKTRRRLTYIGEYYGLDLSARGLLLLKCTYVLLTLTLYAAFMYYVIYYSRGGGAIYASVPAMLMMEKRQPYRVALRLDI